MHAENTVYNRAQLREHISAVINENFQIVAAAAVEKFFCGGVIVAPVFTSERQILIFCLISRKNKLDDKHPEKHERLFSAAVHHCVKGCCHGKKASEQYGNIRCARIQIIEYTYGNRHNKCRHHGKHFILFLTIYMLCHLCASFL